MESGGRPRKVVDRTGVTWAELTWDGDRLLHLDVPGARVVGEPIDDSLLGRAHPIVTPTGEQLTAMSAIDWAHPTEIPAIAAPGRLPPGAGGAILNVLALLAVRAGVPALRYAGPYPTSALWHSLQRSFRPQAGATEAAFARDLVDRMVHLSREPIAIDFAPAPHERIAIPHGHVELRDGLERVVIDCIAYTPDGSPTRLAKRDDGDVAAELWFGDARYATIARLSPDGSVIDGPHAVPACTSDVIGKAFPPQLVAALRELVVDAVPTLLAGDVGSWFDGRTIAWADTGARAARVRDDTLELHAALWQHVAPHGLARLALAIAEAIAPLAIAAVVAELSRATVGA